MLTDINKPEGSNLGGILAFKFLDVSTIASTIDSAEMVQLLADNEYTMYSGYCVEQSMRFSDKQKDGNHGVFFEKEFTGIIPKPKLENEELYSEMEYKKFLLIIKDSNGLVRVVGSPREPLLFTADLESGESIVNLNQHKISFFGKGIKRSPVYTGTNVL